MERKWSKVLYKKTGHPDNYTDSDFLKELKRNLHFKPVLAQSAILASTRISTRISITVLFWIVFLQLNDNNSYWKITYGAFTFFIAVAYTISNRFGSVSSVLKNVVLFLAFGYACTPVLQSLTDTISTDSIYAMTSFLMLIHLVFHQYESNEYNVSSPYLSLNAAVCGAICLASRLSDTKDAFILLTLAAQAFALFPELYETLGYPLVAFGASTISAALAVFSISEVAAAMFLFLLLLINIVFPLCFVWAQKYKDNIYGPWDEALITKI